MAKGLGARRTVGRQDVPLWIPPGAYPTGVPRLMRKLPLPCDPPKTLGIGLRWEPKWAVKTSRSVLQHGDAFCLILIHRAITHSLDGSIALSHLSLSLLPSFCRTLSLSRSLPLHVQATSSYIPPNLDSSSSIFSQDLLQKSTINLFLKQDR